MLQVKFCLNVAVSAQLSKEGGEENCIKNCVAGRSSQNLLYCYLKLYSVIEVMYQIIKGSSFSLSLKTKY